MVTGANRFPSDKRPTKKIFCPSGKRESERVGEKDGERERKKERKRKRD